MVGDFWKPMFQTEREPDPVTWKCYDCGQTDKGFYEDHYYAGDCDMRCSVCHSANTDEDGGGWRSEDCPICANKSEEQVQSDPVCELCEGYATIYPYQLREHCEVVGHETHHTGICLRCQEKIR